MEENGASYANDRQHVTTGHAPARATFLTESTRLSFPLSFSFCYSLHWLSSSHLSLLSFTLYPPILILRFSLSVFIFLRFVFLQPKFSISLPRLPFLYFLVSIIRDLYLTNDFSIDLEFLPLNDKRWSLLIVEWWKRKGSKKKMCRGLRRCRWHYRAVQLFCVFIGFPSSLTSLPGDPGDWDTAVREASGFLLIVLRACIIRI